MPFSSLVNAGLFLCLKLPRERRKNNVNLEIVSLASFKNPMPIWDLIGAKTDPHFIQKIIDKHFTFPNTEKRNMFLKFVV